MVPNLETTMEKGIETLIIQKDVLNGVKQTIKLTNVNIKSSYNVIVQILWSQRFNVLELLGQCQIYLDFERHPIFLPENRYHYLADICGVLIVLAVNVLI